MTRGGFSFLLLVLLSNTHIDLFLWLTKLFHYSPAIDGRYLFEEVERHSCKRGLHHGGIVFVSAKGVAGLGKAGGDGQGGSDKSGQQVPPEVYIALTYAGTAFLFTLSVPLILYGLNKLLNKIEDCFGCGPSSRKEKLAQKQLEHQQQNGRKQMFRTMKNGLNPNDSSQSFDQLSPSNHDIQQIASISLRLSRDQHQNQIHTKSNQQPLLTPAFENRDVINGADMGCNNYINLKASSNETSNGANGNHTKTTSKQVNGKQQQSPILSLDVAGSCAVNFAN